MKIPRTYFSTRLSGSAKETELRIRNIFQWKKKRPPVMLFVLIAVLLLGICGGLVGFTTRSPEDMPEGESAAGPKVESAQDKGTVAEAGAQKDAGQSEDVITNYFTRKLSEISPDTPLVIAEKQIFDWNGTTVVAATATNIVVTDPEADLLRVDGPHPEPNLPERENTVMYLMSALFIDGHEPIDLMHDEFCEVSKDPLEKTASGIAYDYGQEISFQQFLSVIQYKSGEILTACPVFCDHGGELVTRDYKYHPVYSLEDADGDGKVEFVFFRDLPSSLYAKYAVYDWTDGAVQRTIDVLEDYQNLTEQNSSPKPLVYENEEFGFTIRFPESWATYGVISVCGESDHEYGRHIEFGCSAPGLDWVTYYDNPKPYLAIGDIQIEKEELPEGRRMRLLGHKDGCWVYLAAYQSDLPSLSLSTQEAKKTYLTMYADFKTLPDNAFAFS